MRMTIRQNTPWIKNNDHIQNKELYYTITNHSSEPITNDGWTLYCNYMSLHPIYTEGDQILQTELQASYHSITPTADFQPLLPDSKITGIDVEHKRISLSIRALLEDAPAVEEAPAEEAAEEAVAEEAPVEE